jgi:hypothetical protein
MRHIAGKIGWIMLLSGALTCTMGYAIFAPQELLHSLFGETLEGPVADIVVRNWAALVTMVGGLLLVGARYPALQIAALIIATASKLVFIVLVLTFGRPYLGAQAGMAIALDAVLVAIFAAYLLRWALVATDDVNRWPPIGLQSGTAS